MRARESACRPPGSSLAIGLGYVPPLVACSSTPWWAVVLPLHSSHPCSLKDATLQ
jgi:hypothetical protein